MRPTAYADKTLRKSQDRVLYWRWFDEKTVHLSLQLRVSRYLKGDLLKEPDDEYRHLSRRFYWSGYSVRMMNCTTYHTSSTRNVSIPRPRTFCRFGYPRRVLIDENRNFESRNFRWLRSLIERRTTHLYGCRCYC